MKRFYGIVFLGLATALSNVNAVEPLTTAELLKQCEGHESNPASLDTARCRSYLQGYMGGAYAMRTVSVMDIEKKKSAFVERAESTRLGEVDPRYGMNRVAGYCVKQDLTISEFVAQLNRFAVNNPKRPELANQFVYKFLRTEFACKKVKN